MSEQELATEIEELEAEALPGAEQVELDEDIFELNEEESAEESEAEEAAEEAVEELDPLEEFKSKLRRQIGDWYVVHTYSGYENKVKTGIETRMVNLEADDEIYEVQVPTETVTEYKGQKEKTFRRVRVPGYVLVRMEMTDHSWGVVRHTPGVTGFVGQDAYNPVPLRMEEVYDMLLPVYEEERQKQGLPVAQPVVESDYQVGENVRVKSGPFEGMDATISEIKAESRQVVTLISVFERDTPVTLEFSQIEKI